MKVLLILVDGMRPDAITEIPEAKALMEQSSYTLEATTVMPSVTLPCHMSLFHSVDPSRHGITTNIFTPQVRPVDGICEVLKAAKKKSAFFYNWHQLRDLARPGSLSYEMFTGGGNADSYEKTNQMVTDEAIRCIENQAPDFVFLYLGWVDEAGHNYRWMSDEYMRAVKGSWECIDRVIKTLPEDYTVFVTADHGGHDGIHGSEMPEDMNIPVFVKGKGFTPGKILENINIMDIAPTIASITGVEPAEEWVGKIIE